MAKNRIPRKKSDGWRPQGATGEALITRAEAEMALFALGRHCGVVVGKILGYDKGRDEFTVLGQDTASRQILELKMAGERVAAVVTAARLLTGQRQLERRPRDVPRPAA